MSQLSAGRPGLGRRSGGSLVAGMEAAELLDRHASWIAPGSGRSPGRWKPPGVGKPALVASYLAARRHRVLWYQVDGGDSDAATFSTISARRRRNEGNLCPCS